MKGKRIKPQQISKILNEFKLGSRVVWVLNHLIKRGGSPN